LLHTCVLPKKGNAAECSNYYTVALMSHIGKLMMTILTRRLQSQADKQASFWKDRSKIRQILALRLIVEKAKTKGRTIYNCFVDFQKAFDSISHKATWAILQSYGVGTRLIDLLKNTNENAQAAVRVNNELVEWFNVRKGTRQGDTVSPYVFITHLERVMDATKDLKDGIAVHRVSINNLKFADDIDLIGASSSSLQEAAQLLNEQKAIRPSHKQSKDTDNGIWK